MSGASPPEDGTHAFPTLRRLGGRLRLRELGPGDLGRLSDLNAQLFYAYMRHKVGPDGYLAEALAAQNSRDRQLYYIGIVVDGALNGAVDFVDLDPLSGSAELGYFVAPHLEGQGIATISISAVAKILARSAGLRTLSATVDPDNTRSLRLLNRLGFAPVGDGRPVASEYPGDPSNPAHFDRSGRLTLRSRLHLSGTVSELLAATFRNPAQSGIPFQRKPTTNK